MPGRAIGPGSRARWRVAGVVASAQDVGQEGGHDRLGRRRRAPVGLAEFAPVFPTCCRRQLIEEERTSTPLSEELGGEGQGELMAKGGVVAAEKRPQLLVGQGSGVDDPLEGVELLEEIAALTTRGSDAKGAWRTGRNGEDVFDGRDQSDVDRTGHEVFPVVEVVVDGAHRDVGGAGHLVD